MSETPERQIDLEKLSKEVYWILDNTYYIFDLIFCDDNRTPMDLKGIFQRLSSLLESIGKTLEKFKIDDGSEIYNSIINIIEQRRNFLIRIKEIIETVQRDSSVNPLWDKEVEWSRNMRERLYDIYFKGHWLEVNRLLRRQKYPEILDENLLYNLKPCLPPWRSHSDHSLPISVSMAIVEFMREMRRSAYFES